MTATRIGPPLEYLKAASRSSLQSFELARMNHAANLRREIGVLIDQWMKETTDALVARWMLDNCASLQSAPLAPQEVLHAFGTIDDNPLPDSSARPDAAGRVQPRFTAARRQVVSTLGRKIAK